MSKYPDRMGKKIRIASAVVNRDEELKEARIKKIVFDKKVKIIANFAFYDFEYLEEVEIPSSVETIGIEAFAYCKSLKRIVIKGGVKKFGARAFLGSGLEEVIIEEGLKSIPPQTFAECYNLRKVTFPDSLKEIGDGAFSQTSVEEIKLGKNVEVIGAEAFFECPDLKSIILSEKLKNIYGSSLGNCENLEEIKVSENNKNYVIYNGCLYSKDMKALIKVPQRYPSDFLKIPDGVETIGSYAIWECDKIREISLPQSITGMYNRAIFSDKINRVCVRKENGQVKIHSAYLPKGLKEIGSYIVSYINEINIYDGIKSSCWKFIKGIGHYNIKKGGEYSNRLLVRNAESEKLKFSINTVESMKKDEMELFLYHADESKKIEIDDKTDIDSLVAVLMYSKSRSEKLSEIENADYERILVSGRIEAAKQIIDKEDVEMFEFLMKMETEILNEENIDELVEYASTLKNKNISMISYLMTVKHNFKK